jgi:hypothetical protein
MKKSIKLNIVTSFIIGFFLFGHMVYLNAPFVNQECVFSEAAQGIVNPAYAIGLEKFWKMQANPLGYPLVTAITISILNTSFWSVRLPSLFGGIAILLSGWAFYRNSDNQNDHLFFLWITTTMLNPLVWMYSGQATADVLPVGLMALSFLFCYLAKNRFRIHLMGAICLSLAVIVKFNSILLGLGFVYIIFRDQSGKMIYSKGKRIIFLLYSLLPAFFLLMYFLIVHELFGIVFIPEKFKVTHFSGHLVNILSYFAMYVSYLTMLLGLLSLVVLNHLWKVLSGRNLLILVMVSLLSAIVFSNILGHFSFGEMDYGRHFNALLSKEMVFLMRGAGLILGIFLFVELTYNAFSKKNSFAIFLLFTLLPYLIIASSSRPVQRYLLFCLPFLSYYIIVILGSQMPRLTSWLGWTSVAVLALVTSVSIFYQVEQGRAADKMAQWLISKNYIRETNAGSIIHHACQYFDQDPNIPTKYTVKMGKNPLKDYIHKESVILLGKEISTHYLVRQKVKP